MDTKELKKILKAKWNEVRSVTKGVGSCRGYISVCCATYDDQHKTFRCEQIREFMKQNYPQVRVFVY